MSIAQVTIHPVAIPLATAAQPGPCCSELVVHPASKRCKQYRLNVWELEPARVSASDCADAATIATAVVDGVKMVRSVLSNVLILRNEIRS